MALAYLFIYSNSSKTLEICGRIKMRHGVVKIHAMLDECDFLAKLERGNGEGTVESVVETMLGLDDIVRVRVLLARDFAR